MKRNGGRYEVKLPWKEDCLDLVSVDISVEISAMCRSSGGECRSSIGRVSTDMWPTVGHYRLSVDSRSMFGRYFADRSPTYYRHTTDRSPKYLPTERPTSRSTVGRRIDRYTSDMSVEITTKTSRFFLVFLFRHRRISSAVIEHVNMILAPSFLHGLRWERLGP